MPDQRSNGQNGSLSNRAMILFNMLNEMDSLDALITLTCTALDVSLYICDQQGNLIAHGTNDDVKCQYWENIITSGHVEKKLLKAIQSPRPYNTSMKEEQCGEHNCSRLIFPLDEDNAPGRYMLCLFFWDRSLTYEDQCIAAVLAGAFSNCLQKHSQYGHTLESRRIQLMRELLGYKAGLKPYFISSIRQLELQSIAPPYRLVCVRLTSAHQTKAAEMARRFSARLKTWCFDYNGWLVAIFTQRSVKQIAEALEDILDENALCGCVSMAFFDLLKMRGIFEDCCSAYSIAHARESDKRLYMAEHYQCMTFLARCQQFFSLDDHYPECLTRLIRYDRENGRSYLTTLTAYLENNMNANAAAKQIFMHRNTMTMQLEKIEQIMGISLSDKELCLYLRLCLRMNELIELSGPR